MTKKICYLSFIALFFYMTLINSYIEIDNMPLILGAIMALSFVVLLITHPMKNITEWLNFEIVMWVIFTIAVFFSGIFVTEQLYLSTDTFFRTITTWIEYLIAMIIVVGLCIYDRKVDKIVAILLSYSVIALFLLITVGVEFQESGRYAVSDLQNPNTLGIAFVFGIFAVLYFWDKMKKSKFLAVILVAGIIYGIVRTGSRKSLFAGLLLIALWFIFSFLPEIRRASFGMKLLAAVSVVIVVLAVIVIFLPEFYNTVIYERIVDVFEGRDAESRINYYKIAVELFKENPVFGVGWENFRFFSDNGFYSHSTYAEAISCFGIVGCFFYFVPYLTILVKCVRIWSISGRIHDKNLRYTSSLMLSLMLVLIFLGIGVIHFYVFFSTIAFGVIIAFINITVKRKPGIVGFIAGPAQYIRKS